MFAARRLLAHRHVALLLCAATLLLRLLVPAGYMIDSDHGRPTVTLCSGTTSTASLPSMAGMHHAGMADHGKGHGHAEAGAPCAFAVVGAASLALLETVPPIVPMALVQAARIVPATMARVLRSPRIRPPTRAPPTL